MPVECCSRDAPPRPDACMFGCGYLNGGCQVATAQFLLFAGTMLSVSAFGDCSLVTLDPGISVTQNNVADLLVDRVGLLTFASPGMSTCYWYDDGNDPENQLQEYFNYLGDDWYLLRIFAAVGASGGAFFLLYTLSMCCSSHVKALRTIVAFMLCVALTLFQCLIFLVFTSDLCSEHECTFSRSSGWNVGAALCYFASGVCYLLMKDYPGRQVVKEIPGSFPSFKAPTAPVDQSTIQDDYAEGRMEEEAIAVENDNVVVAEPVVAIENHDVIQVGEVIPEAILSSNDVEAGVNNSDTTPDEATPDAARTCTHTTTDNATQGATTDPMTVENLPVSSSGDTPADEKPTAQG